MGKNKLKENDRKMTWYEDFLEFQKKIFYTFLTPPQYSDDPNARWDTWRICDYDEVLAFYSLAYWYT